MGKQQKIKMLVIPLVMFILTIGLAAGCNNKKANSSNEMENNGTAMSGQQTSMNNSSQTFQATLSGDSEVPSVTTDATGNVSVTLSDDDHIQVNGQFSGLSSDYVASHIHKGAKGKNGSPVQPLDPSINDDKTSGSFDGSYTLDDSVVQALKNGMLYINVHSQNHKEGEIRGQLTASNTGMDNSMNSDSTMQK